MAKLQVGFSRLDMTPPLGVRMAGYFFERKVAGVRDPLYISAIAVRDGEKTCIVMNCDHLGFRNPAISKWLPQIAAAAGVPDVDISITTRELARLIKRLGIKFDKLPDEEFDSPLGSGTGAAVIFGATGGVMEAALRTAVWKLTGEKADSPIEFKEVRGTAGIKEATYNINGMDVNMVMKIALLLLVL